MEIAWFAWTALFSVIGLALVIYSKNQGAMAPLGCGLALMIYPYFVPDVWLLVAIGVVLTVVPFKVRG